jgi:hypothetical protein
MPLGTMGLLRLPFQDKGLQVIALTGLMSPAIRSKGGTDRINLILALRRDETVGIHVATIEQVGPRQQLPGGYIVPDRRSHHTIGCGSRGGVNGVKPQREVSYASLFEPK